MPRRQRKLHGAVHVGLTDAMGLFDVIPTVKTVVGWLARLMRSPIRVEVHWLSLQDPRDMLVFGAAPIRYYVEAELVNRKESAVFIQRVGLTVGDRTYVKTGPIRLEPGECRMEKLTFGLSDETEGRDKGAFLLKFVPTLGRRTVVKGVFPLGHGQ